MDILVFKTNITNMVDATRVRPLLSAMSDIRQYNFDLEDCDNILRVVSNGIEPQTISHILQIAGFRCEELSY